MAGPTGSASSETGQGRTDWKMTVLARTMMVLFIIHQCLVLVCENDTCEYFNSFIAIQFNIFSFQYILFNSIYNIFNTQMYSRGQK